MTLRTAAPSLALAAAIGGLLAQRLPPAPNDPWRNPNLPPDRRADLVMEQMTLDEKIVAGSRRSAASRRGPVPTAAPA